MREIASPLSGPFTTFGQTPIDIYKVGAYRPELAYSFYNDYYRRGRQPVNLLEAITHTRNGNATMTDSSGNIVWAPHNLLTYSEDFSAVASYNNSNVTLTKNYATSPDGSNNAERLVGTGTWFRQENFGHTIGHKITTSMWVKSNTGSDQTFRLYGDNTQVSSDLTATTEWQLFSFEYTVTTGGSTGDGITRDVSSNDADLLIYGRHAYRSDLGGMANNPDRGDSYVPTTSSAVYLPRRGHHVYNGSQWVNKGLLVESEARTNLNNDSADFSGWSGSRASVSVDQSTSPDGTTNADKIIDTVDVGTHSITKIVSGSVATHCQSVYAKAGELDWIILYDADAAQGRFFDLTNGVAGTDFIAPPTSYGITDEGNGWYRCWITYTAAATNRNRIYVATGDNVSSYGGTGSDGVYVYGHQFELGSTPSSYIPTSGSSVTRAAESITIPAANLPWPEPVYVTNEELVTNGTFDTDTSGWIGADCSIAAVSGELEITSDGTTQYGYANAQSIPVVVGETYVFSGTYISGTGNGTRFTLTGATTRNVPADNATTVAKTLTFSFVAQSTSLFVQGLVYSADGTSRTGYFDNVSVKEINPLALSIQMKGEMTYADTGAFAEVRPFQWVLDGSNFLDVTLSTSGANTGQVWHRQTALGTPDNVTSSATTYSPDVNVPFNIASRHGSTFVNGAVGGTSLTENTTPTALPDLSATDLQLGYDMMGTISLFRIWGSDIGDDGISEAST